MNTRLTYHFSKKLLNVLGKAADNGQVYLPSKNEVVFTDYGKVVLQEELN